MQAYRNTKSRTANRRDDRRFTEKLFKIYNRMEMLIYGIHKF